MWSDRIDRLKKLRAGQPGAPYDWVPADQLVAGDRFEFGGDWFRVIAADPVAPHVQMTAACGANRTVIDYLAFEMVKVARPDRTRSGRA